MYFSVLNGLSQTLNNKLQKLQYCAARVIITKSRYDASAGPLLNMLGWDRVLISLIKQKAVVMSKTLNNQMPPYVQDIMFSVRDFYYNIRRSENILHVSKTRD